MRNLNLPYNPEEYYKEFKPDFWYKLNIAIYETKELYLKIILFYFQYYHNNNI
jgi:hypothetical protein